MKKAKISPLRLTRIVLAAIFFCGITLLLLDVSGALHRWLGWMAKVQLLPAMLALNFGIVGVLILLTLIFGRVYCSVICPLGIMQDIISWLHGKTEKKNRFRFKYSPAKNILRTVVLAIFIILMVAGLNSLAIIIAPYSAYGRIASSLFAPIYAAGNNLLALLAEKVGSYAFYETEIWIKGVGTFAVAAATFAVIAVLAWKSGRAWCNSICPVGTVLGFISRFSLLKVQIDSSKCRGCKLCGRQCKASCIDMEHHKIDYSRCVACMDCIDTCNDGAISYHFAIHGRKEEKRQDSNPSCGNGMGRRAFLTTAAITGAGAVLKAQKKTDGGLAPVIAKQAPKRENRLTPPGSASHRNFHDHCTGCQLCVQNCPNGVLRPSSSLTTFLQPEMSFERGFCRPECNVCSQVCPAGAILPISVEEKSSIQTGRAVVELEMCIAYTEESSCGNCARHCPAGAIKLVRKDPDNKSSALIPVPNPERCIGCGACEHLCPVRPLSAIHIEGNPVHRIL
ncbi:MAG: 4Fe-4S binding protein [Candidatus Cryptobacteroides sp.]